MWAGRAFVIIIAVIAFILALNPNNSVLGLVSYAWAGLGAAFGPVVLFALFSRKTSWRSVLTGMLLGTITLIYWKESGLGSTLYEIVPGFLVNVIVIMIGNKIYTQKNKGVLAEFDEVQRIYERDI
jgi:sodium/proline symporter